MRSRRFTIMCVIAVLVTSTQAAAGHDRHPDGPTDDPARGLVYRGLRPATDGPCVGGFEIVGLPSQCTHGPDPAPAGMDVRRPSTAPLRTTPPGAGAIGTGAIGTGAIGTGAIGTGAIGTGAIGTGAILCDGDGQTGNRVQMVYVHPPGTDRYAAMLAKFRTVAAEVDDIYNRSAQATGGTRHVRYVTDASCQVSVLNIQMSAASLATFGEFVTALQAQGHNRTDRKYLAFVEATVFCGLGSLANNSSPGATNPNNRGPHYARIDAGCWDNSLATEVAAHEMGHNLGAVQLDAPHTTTRFHCTDEYDRMCGADGPDHPPVIVCADPALELRLDCNHDDYYSTNPPAGSYLATHWNVATSSFLVQGGPSVAVTGDWDGIGGTGIGVAASYGGFVWEMAQRDQLSTGSPSYEPFRYGNSACVPVSGDWNGDGTTTMGVVCRSGIEWRWNLRDSLSGGAPTVPAFNYGNNACAPVTGDWNGDGTTTIGVACKSGLEWRWNLRNANSAGSPSVAAFNYGNNACAPVTGDWNGDTTTTIGVACKTALLWEWALRDGNSGGVPSYPVFRFGNSS